jgi:hypothetical protein
VPAAVLALVAAALLLVVCHAARLVALVICIRCSFRWIQREPAGEAVLHNE